MKRAIRCSIYTVLLLLTHSTAIANDIKIGPSSITTTCSSVNYQLEGYYTANENGLTGDTHTNLIGTNPRVPPPAGDGTMWLSNGTSGEWIKYEFDQVYSLTTMWVWNYNQDATGLGDLRVDRGIRDCTIKYSTNGINWAQLGGSHTFAVADGTSTYSHNTEVDFGGVQAKFVRINCISNHGGSSAGLSEVRFYSLPLSPTIGFEAESSSGMETITPASVEVALFSPEPNQTYTVDYAVTGGTATGAGVDYNTVEPNTLTFNPGETSKNISIDIIDDGLQEVDETIIISIFNATGPSVSLGTSQHVYTIVDGLPHVLFGSSSSNAPENSTPALIQVNLTHASDQTVMVDYAVTGGTAAGGSVDYDLVEPNTLIFSPGETSKNISINIIDDDEKEEDETIVLGLFNPTNVNMGSIVEHNYTILNDDHGIVWNGLTWYYSELTGGPFVNDQGQLEWDPKGVEQYVTRIPEQSLSSVGDKAEVTYWWLTDGDHDCPDCFTCPGCFDDDITCVAGMSDIRVGLFEADGEYVEQDGLGIGNSIFTGYKGYNWRFGPNMNASPTSWTDCTGERHGTGHFVKKIESKYSLMTINEGLMGRLPGFELPPGEWSLLTVSLERLSSSSVKMSITLNGRTYTDTDSSSRSQPSKIDVFGVHLRNHRPYDRLVLDNYCAAVGDADFDGDDIVNENDLNILSQAWLATGGAASVPDANYLVVHYNFDETSGSTAYDSSIWANDGAVQVVSTGVPKIDAWDTGGQKDGCINFDGNTNVVVSSASTVFAGVNSEVTVSMWINGNAAVQPDPDWGMVFQAGKTGNDRVLLAHIPTGNNTGVMFESGGYNLQRLTWGGASDSDWEGDWNHYAFTVDVAVENEVKIFHNGEPVLTKNATTGVGGITSFLIGNGFEDGINYEYWGKIDDFRVYSYALNEDEIAHIAFEGVLPPDSPANLHLDGIIDLKDYSVFASYWLKGCD